MITLDNPADVLRFLAEPIRAIRAALDHGVSWAATVLEARPRDAHMWAHLVRFEARNEMGDGGEGWRVRRLANSGIEVVATPLVMRTMKTQDGGPPSPGHSHTRRAFWAQQTEGQKSLELEWGEIREPADGANLILGWSPGADSSVELALAKPIATWKYKGQPKLAWSRPVEFDTDDVPHFMVADEDVEVEPKFDLGEFGPEGANQ